MDRDTEPTTTKGLAPSWRLVYLSFLFTIAVAIAWLGRELTAGRTVQAQQSAVADSIRLGVALAQEGILRGEQNSRAIAAGVQTVLERLDRLELRAARQRTIQTAAVVASVKVVEAKIDTVAAVVDTVATVQDSVLKSAAPEGRPR
jgi:uncharacterized coiled-coil protein SlyX